MIKPEEGEKIKIKETLSHLVQTLSWLIYSTMTHIHASSQSAEGRSKGFIKWKLFAQSREENEKERRRHVTNQVLLLSRYQWNLSELWKSR